MFNNLLQKTIYDKRWFIFGWSIGVVVMASITIGFFPTIKDQIGELFSNIPKALQGVTGNTEDYKNIIGYVGTGVFDLRMPMLTITMAIILALNISAAEESSGKLYQLLAQPISRSKIMAQKWAAMMIVFALVHSALFIGIVAVVELIGESMPLQKIASGTLMCFLLTAAIGSLTIALGFGQGRKGLTTMIVTTYVFGSYLLTSFAAQVEWLRHIEPVSIFHYYQASTALKQGIDWGNITSLIAIIVVALLVGTAVFNRRDVGTHNA